MDIELKLNVHKTLKRRPTPHLMRVQFTSCVYGNRNILTKPYEEKNNIFLSEVIKMRAFWQDLSFLSWVSTRVIYCVLYIDISNNILSNTNGFNGKIYVKSQMFTKLKNIFHIQCSLIWIANTLIFFCAIFDLVILAIETWSIFTLEV